MFIQWQNILNDCLGVIWVGNELTTGIHDWRKGIHDGVLYHGKGCLEIQASDFIAGSVGTELSIVVLLLHEHTRNVQPAGWCRQW